MRAGIALGSNIGERLSFLRRSAQLLAALSETSAPVLRSRIYETGPVEMPRGTEQFLNAVVEIESSSAPEELFGELRHIEENLGRPARRARQVSRTIDLDLLYLDDTRLVTGSVLLPHPRLHLRAFVLRPLRDIRPDLRLPGFSATVAELASALPPGEDVSATALSWK